LTPAGVADISRWLSAATPPESSKTIVRPWRGRTKVVMQAAEGLIVYCCDPIRGRVDLCLSTGGVAIAQPPANVCDPSGIKNGRIKSFTALPFGAKNWLDAIPHIVGATRNVFIRPEALAGEGTSAAPIVQCWCNSFVIPAYGTDSNLIHFPAELIA